MNRFERRFRGERTAVLGIALLTGLLSVAAVSSLLPGTTAATNHVIDMNDYFFSPKFITIAAGDTVQWHNAGFYQHTATSNSSAWSEIILNAGQTSSMITLNTDGNYSYICSNHFLADKMWGAIQVGTSTIPEFSSSLLVVTGLLVLMIGMMLLGGRRKAG